MSIIRLPAAALAAPIAALGLALGATALAPAPAVAQSETQSASFTDDQLDSFAVAAVEVSDIRTRYMSQIQGAGSEEEKQALAKQAQQEMLGAVKNAQGITVEDYNAIIQAASQDPDLAEKVKGKIEAAKQ